MFYIDIVLSDDQRAALIDKDLNFSEMTVGTEAYHRHGIAFSSDDCEAVLDVLGLIRNEHGRESWLSTPQGRQLEDYLELSLLEMPTPMNPIIWVNNYDQSHYDEEVFSGFQADSGLGLAIKYSDFEYAEHRYRKGVLFVSVLGSPSENHEIGRPFSGSDGRVLVPHNLGKDYVPIVHSDGRPMAYFRGDSNGGSLWLLFRTSYYGREPLEYVLYTVKRLVRPELGAILSYEEYENIAERERYIGLAGRRLQEESNQADQRVNSSAEHIERVRRELVTVLQQADAVRHRREELQSGDTGEMLRQMKERLAKEFDELSSSPDFESLEFREDRVVATTRLIKLRHEGRVYEMGKYEIRIHREGYIEVAGLNRAGHPHISGGNPCFGNSSEGVAKLQAEMSFGILLPFLVNYLENGYNPADSYSKIEDYDVKNYPESKEVKKPAKAKAKRKGKAKAKPKAKSSKPRRKSAKRKPKGAKK